ncbi:uncharacterized protein LOC132734348 [Ruditapes philippinarum]|uniref:uncharacterized protein LOC132734348 n=1 Tax=Ruditapes philippinarum TaxID=129788 RepID=UPI00295A960F|nr:uncharacterized protein LOC132734348 [Ruditapes philippinarum]
MAGQFSSETKQKLLENISDFIQNDGRSFIGIDIDDLGYRLQVKLNMVPQKVYGFHYSLQTFALVYINFAFILSDIHQHFFKELQNENIEKINQSVGKLVFQMTYAISNGERLQHTIFKFLAPLTFTTYGSALASSSFGANNQVLPEAMDWLSAGLTSDVTSGRLKMASVFYSIGEMEKAEEILRRTEQLYNSHPVLSICSRLLRSPPTVSEDFAKVCIEDNEDCIKHIVAFCVHFIPQEINCVPHELQYEMFRSTQDDKLYRDPLYDCWMDWATVDSLPFLYFLQYKIYSHLQRQEEKQQALDNIKRTIVTEENISHIETALNILGQCMEQENRPQDALEYYIRSLQQRTRNNAANIHICRLLSRLLVAK